jgi:hypothetical protein
MIWGDWWRLWCVRWAEPRYCGGTEMSCCHLSYNPSSGNIPYKLPAGRAEKVLPAQKPPGFAPAASVFLCRCSGETNLRLRRWFQPLVPHFEAKPAIQVAQPRDIGPAPSGCRQPDRSDPLLHRSSKRQAGPEPAGSAAAVSTGSLDSGLSCSPSGQFPD